MKAGRCHYCGLGFVQVRDEWPSSPQFEQRWGVRVLTVPAKSCSSSRSISSRFEISSFAHAILASSMATPSLLAGVEKWFRALSPYWDLTECVSKDACPLDANTKNNLRFLIGLRHQVEHKKADGLDSYLSARHQARALTALHPVERLRKLRRVIDVDAAQHLFRFEQDRRADEYVFTIDQRPRRLAGVVTGQIADDHIGIN